MDKDKALDLALEALESGDGWRQSDAIAAITAIKQARALDKKAENARELGLDYEPVCHICNGTGERDSGGTHPWGWAINIPCECTAPPAQPAPVQPIIGSYLEKDNSQFKFSEYESDGVHHNKPAVPAPVQGPVAIPDCGEAGHADGACGTRECLPSFRRAAALATTLERYFETKDKIKEELKKKEKQS